MTLSKTQSGKQISCSKTHEKEEIIRYFYIRENELFHRGIHKRAGTVEQNIKDTLASISDSSQMYVVKSGNDIAGFFVVHTELFDYMEGMHIGKELRTKEFIPKFWEIVKQTFGRSFETAIYVRNEPAINHLMKQGFVITGKRYLSDKTFIMLKLNF